MPSLWDASGEACRAHCEGSPFRPLSSPTSGVNPHIFETVFQVLFKVDGGFSVKVAVNRPIVNVDFPQPEADNLEDFYLREGSWRFSVRLDDTYVDYTAHGNTPPFKALTHNNYKEFSKKA
jgi:hypothetical protein